MKRILVIVLCSALCAFVGYGILRAGDDEKPTPTSDPEIVFAGGKIFGRRITTKSWTASFDKILSSPDQSVLDVQNVHDGVIYKRGKPYMRVRTQHMTVNTVTHDFSMTGPTEMETIGARPTKKFTTTAAVWNDTLKTLTLSQPVDVALGSPVSTTMTFASATINITSGAVDARGIVAKRASNKN